MAAQKNKTKQKNNNKQTNKQKNAGDRNIYIEPKN